MLSSGQLVVFAQKPDGRLRGTATLVDSGRPAGGFPPDSDAAKPSVNGVEALGIVNDPSPDRLVFDPGNPDADGRGYVHYPNVQIVQEMVDMMAASRAYEANVAVVQESKAASAATTGLLSS